MFAQSLRSVQVEIAEFNDQQLLHVADKKKTGFSIDLVLSIDWCFSQKLPVKLMLEIKIKLVDIRPEQTCGR